MDYAVLKRIPSSRHYENIEFRTIVDKSLGMEVKESKPIFNVSPAFSKRESVRIDFQDELTAYYSDGGVPPMGTLPRFKSRTPVGRYYYYEEQYQSSKPKCDVKGFPRKPELKVSSYCPDRPHRFLRARPSSPPLCSFCKEREQRRVVHQATQTEPVEPSRGAVFKRVFDWSFRRKEKPSKKDN